MDTHTSVPPTAVDRSSDWIADNIATLSRVARSIHLVYVGFLVYCAFTVFVTLDRQIILNEGAKLPLLNIDIPFSIFLIIAPIVAAFLFIYFQLHVQIARRTILEAITSRGLPKERIYPWMITLSEFRPEPGGLGILQRVLVHVSLWWLLPIVLFLLTSLSLKLRKPGFIVIELLISLTGTVLVFWLHNRYQNIRTGASGTTLNLRHLPSLIVAVKNPSTRRRLILGALYASAYVVLLLSFAYAKQYRLFTIDVSRQTLRGAWLRDWQLQGSSFEGADLRDADLSNSRLEDAQFAAANLQNAKIRAARLNGANLSCTIMSDADLDGSDLTDAYFVRTNLSRANVTWGQLCTARNLFGAIIENQIEGDLKAYCPAYGRLRQEPPSLDDTVDGYQSANDTNSSLRELTYALTGDPVNRMPPTRFLKTDRTILVWRRNPAYSLNEVRFITTASPAGKLYLRAITISQNLVSCASPPR